MKDILNEGEKSQQAIGFLSQIVENKEVKLQNGTSIRFQNEFLNKIRNWNNLNPAEMLGFINTFFNGVDTSKALGSSGALYSDLNNPNDNNTIRDNNSAVNSYVGFFLRNNEDAFKGIDNLNNAIRNILTPESVLEFYLTGRRMEVNDSDIYGFTNLGTTRILSNPGNYTDKTLDCLVELLEANDASIYSNDLDLKDDVKAIIYTNAKDFTSVDNALNAYLPEGGASGILSAAEQNQFRNDLVKIMKARTPEIVSKNFPKKSIDDFLNNILIDKNALSNANEYNIRDSAYGGAGERFKYTTNTLKVYETITKLNGRQ